MDDSIAQKILTSFRLVARWLQWFQASHRDMPTTREKKDNILFVSFLETRKLFIEIPSTLAMTITESSANSLNNLWQEAQESHD